jgi:hypothetical protein
MLSGGWTYVLSVVAVVFAPRWRAVMRGAGVDRGDLTDEQIERIGATLTLLEEKMTELREHFGLEPEDLNIDLGPLGPLLSTDG